VTLELLDMPLGEAELPVESATAKTAGLGHIALLGNFLPRRCGIPTFTADVHAALGSRFADIAVDVYAMDDAGAPYDYPRAVTASIAQDDPVAYRQAAQAIKASGADLLWVQHEYGIFGGPAGDLLLGLLDAIDLPVVVTLHTVLAEPTPDQRRVMNALVRRSARLFVMAERALDLLTAVYGADPSRIRMIPHGVPDRAPADSAAAKARLGFAGRHVLLTFGLLSPGKGIETMIAAMPAIVARHPEALYVVLGATHPNLLAREGEAYRESLVAQAEALGVAGHIRWLDVFLETDQLLDYLAATDIYVTPYLGAQQMTSGTLAYAVGAGLAIVSTPYVHAKELLAGGHGRLVGFGDSAGFAAAIYRLLDDDDERTRMRRANRALGRTMLWPRLVEAAVEEMRGALADAPRRVAPAAMIAPARASFAAVARLSDDTGMIQHSSHGVPDRGHGYCVDDNARALILMQQATDLSDALYRRWTPVYAAFVQHAWNPDADRFRNFMGFDRRWLEDAGSEDSSARALWSLAVTARDGRGADLREWAAASFDRAAPHALDFSSPRALAFAMLAGIAMAEAQPGHGVALELVETGGQVLASGLAAHRRPGWCWPEPWLAYDNARLPEALIRAGGALDRREWAASGIAALDWLMERQRAPEGHFRPVGTHGFGRRYAEPSQYDQQPLEAWATIDACAAAFAATGARRWREAAFHAYRWFEGGNDGGVALADAASGECHDGLGPHGPNLNRGAESVLAFQLANRAIRALADR